MGQQLGIAFPQTFKLALEARRPKPGVLSLLPSLVPLGLHLGETLRLGVRFGCGAFALFLGQFIGRLEPEHLFLCRIQALLEILGASRNPFQLGL
ncbi:hypothetical protein M9Y84_30895, partial [Pseudomonas aeruginosa]|uniref:hypothetical protein n=2 Tax=Pseudomonas aeruginosa TaxID=287 RepID=UPI0020236571